MPPTLKLLISAKEAGPSHCVTADGQLSSSCCSWGLDGDGVGASPRQPDEVHSRSDGAWPACVHQQRAVRRHGKLCDRTSMLTKQMQVVDY
jgi:hypothetical protein